MGILTGCGVPWVQGSVGMVECLLACPSLGGLALTPMGLGFRV